MYRRPLKSWVKHLDFILLDMLCLHLGFALAYWYRFGTGKSPYEESIYGNIIVVMTLIDVLVAVLFSSYSKVLRRGLFQQLIASGKHAFIVLATATVYLFSTQMGDTYSRITIGLTAVFHLILSYLVTVIYKKLRWSKQKKDRSMLIISTAREAVKAIESIRQDQSGTIHLTGVAVLDLDLTGEKLGGLPVVANRETLEECICREWVDEVYIRLTPGEHLEDMVYHSLREMGVTIHIDATAYANLAGCDFVVEQIGDGLVFTTSMKMAPLWQLALKRLMDIMGGLVGCLLTALIAICIAPFIWKESPGPLFFSQVRVGQNGKKFKIYKFRSMYMDAEERKKELAAKNRVSSGLMFKLDWDPRIIGNRELPDGTRKTGIGEFIRKTSLDEFPQFFNVLKGDMSVVGTRPPTVDEWEKYELHHRARLATKPGITGMWQVSGRSEIRDFNEITKLDTQYITNWNIGLDIKILFKTVSVVLTQRGAM